MAKELTIGVTETSHHQRAPDRREKYAYDGDERESGGRECHFTGQQSGLQQQQLQQQQGQAQMQQRQ